jgi:uncharacterized surface protein with fasciclin (FAS1) repeats
MFDADSDNGDRSRGKLPTSPSKPASAALGLVKPENKATVTKVLTYQVVPSEYDFNALGEAIMKSNGKVEL